MAEPTRTVDLTALVGSLCEDLGDIGEDVAFEDGPRIPHRRLPNAFRRAVRNVVENGVRYRKPRSCPRRGCGEDD